MGILKNPVIPYIIAIVAVFFLFRQCQKTQEAKQEQESLQDFVTDTVSYYENRLGQEVAQKTALQGDKSSLEVLLAEKNDTLGQLRETVRKFKSVDAAGSVTTITEIDTVEIRYEVPVESQFSREWNRNEDFYNISGTSTNEGITIENLQIPNRLTFAIGDRKTGLFSSEYRIEATNSNPYVRTTGLDAYTLTTSKGVISVDAQAGYGLTIYGDTPYVGIGLGLDLWQVIKGIFK